jgi:beta-lactamase regulating signal transducer with metallopeptidase domain
MIQLTQSPFLQALGFAIINSLWQFALLWLVYTLLTNLFKFTSHQKYATSLSLQFAGFAWFTGTIIFYYQQCSVVYNNALPEILITDQSTVAISTGEKLINFLLKGEQLLPYLSLAYIILLVLLSIKAIQAYRNTQLIRQQGLDKVNVHLRLFVQKVALQLGIKRPVKLYVSSLVQSPLTLGFLKPLILLPIATINHLSTEQLEAILLHELAHIKRNDYFINLLLSIIEIALFFNPFMQLLSRNIKRERENSCDDWVLQYEYNAASYANALLTIARNKNYSSPKLTMNAMDNNRALLIRVKRMIEKNDRSYNYRQRLIALVVMTVFISGIAWLTPTTTSSRVKGQVKKVKVVEPITAKVKNPLFNPVFFLANEEKKQIASEIEKAVSEISKTEAAINLLPLPPVAPKETSILKELSKPLAAPIAIAPGTNGLFPDIFLNTHAIDSAIDFAIQPLVNKSSSEWDKIEQEIEKLHVHITNANFNPEWNSEKVQRQLALAVTELKKLNVRFNKKTAALQAHQKEESERDFRFMEKAEVPKVEFRKLAENIKQQLNELELQKIVLKDMNENFEVDINIPSVVYAPAPAENGNWSYTYSQRPRQIVKQNMRSTSANTNDDNDIERSQIDEEKKAKQTATPSCETIIKKRIAKRILIVKI